MAVLEEHPVRAVDQYRPDILHEAERLCREDLSERPRDPDLLHLRGLIAADAKRDTIAIAYLRRGLLLDASRPHSLSALGESLTRRGDYAQAVTAHLAALRLLPGRASVYRRLGRTLQQQGRLREAHAMWCEALRLEPDHGATILAVAELLRLDNRIAESLAFGEQTLLAGKHPRDAWEVIGDARLCLTDWARAAAAFREGVDLSEAAGVADAILHRKLGTALLNAGRPEEAAERFRKALDINPEDIEACQQLAIALDLVERSQDAVGAWFAVGALEESQGRLREAQRAYREAITRKADCLRAILGLGRVCLRLGELHESIVHFRKATDISPQHAQSHIELGRALHVAGEFDRAWDELSWLFYPHVARPRPFTQPRWDGTSLQGRTILLWCGRDDELTDVVRSLRYVRPVSSTGAKVIVEVPSPLLSLLHGLTGADRVVGQQMPLPAFDVQAPLASIPMILEELRGPVPLDHPLLFAEPKHQRRWKSRLGECRRMNVGLAWAPHSPPVGATDDVADILGLTPLANARGVRFVSLQLGSAADELVCAPGGLTIESLLDLPPSLADFAALVSALDLVITADLLVAQLAGALSVPVWACLSSAPDWRWPANGDTSPWHTGTRLFRRARTENCCALYQRVRRALDLEVDTFVDRAAALGSGQ